MRCPQCSSDLEPIELRSVGGSVINAKHCLGCGGIWLSRPLTERISTLMISRYDKPIQNYSLKHLDIICSQDKTLMQQNEIDLSGARSWSCPDCGGQFFPKGQLAILSAYQEKTGNLGVVSTTRIQAAGMVTLSFVLLVMVLAVLNRGVYEAVAGQPLPTAGPNVLALVLLSLIYVAGTVLAVLGRRLVAIIVGWIVIAICLVCFIFIIFSP